MRKHALVVLSLAVLPFALTVPAVGQLTSSAPPVTPQPHHPNLIVPQVLRRHWPRQEAGVELTAVSASIQIVDQVATTTLELTLTNPSGRAQEAQVLLPVPEGVAVRSLQYDGVGSETNAEVLPREEARRIYESIVRSMRDPALVEFVGLGLIRTSAFPVPAGASQKLRLTMEQVLVRDGARVDYVIPRAEALAEDSVAWTLTADIRSKAPIATVYSSSHDVVTERVGPGHVRVRMERGSVGDTGSVRLSYLLDARA